MKLEKTAELKSSNMEFQLLMTQNMLMKYIAAKEKVKYA